KLFAIMHFDDHGQFKELIVRDKSGKVTTGIDPSFEFVFEEYMSINTPPLPRTPTPAMIWVTDTLKKIHEEWEERKKGTKE
ncbi:MAG TPA: hypothetical protein VHO70_03675, partial [Chitinispirillaceae bacterium]|nr:hypothetical protein [Chitinispirillaceae bacterium]